MEGDKVSDGKSIIREAHRAVDPDLTKKIEDKKKRTVQTQTQRLLAGRPKQVTWPSLQRMWGGAALMCLLWKLDEICHVKHLKQFLAHRNSKSLFSVLKFTIQRFCFHSLDSSIFLPLFFCSLGPCSFISYVSTSFPLPFLPDSLFLVHSLLIASFYFLLLSLSFWSQHHEQKVYEEKKKLSFGLENTESSFKAD